MWKPSASSYFHSIWIACISIYPPILLLYTGLRVGELTAMHWNEADLKKATVTVKYNLCRLDGEYRLSTPKTKSSARVVALPPQALKLLQEQKEWQEVGDFPDIHIHDLRHTYATNFISI